MITDWPHLYGEGWQKEIVPEAFSHPAKFSRALIRHIYDHCIAEGWLAEGDTVIDPFGGVALGGLDAMRLGAHWVGVELEAKFVALGAQNIALWNSRYAGRFAKWGTARLIQGDSRRLLEVIRDAGMAVTSPPFSPSGTQPASVLQPGGRQGVRSSYRKVGADAEDNYGSTPGNLGNLRADEKGFNAAISSPPFGEGETRNRSEYQDGEVASMMSRAYTQDKQGNTEGNLSAMHADEKGFAAALSSPPYIDGARQQGTDNHPERMQGSEFHPARYDLSVTSPPFLQTSGGTNVTSESGPLSDPALIARHAAGNAAAGYGDEMASLSKLPEGDAPSLTISSPPYSESMERKGGIDPTKSEHVGGPHSQMNRSDTRYGETAGQIGSMPEGDLNNIAQVVSSPPYEGTELSGGGGIANEYRNIYREGQNYGDELGQLGAEVGDTFWSAAKLIVAQTYAALRPGGHAVWVVKAFVRNKAIVDFPGQWRALCESIGFTTLHEHHALLTEDHGTQTAMDGNHKRHVKERKSFFRRLAEKKGSPRIDYEVVLCMVK